MATTVPAKLRTADVQRFATRAAQLVRFKPIVTYWCEYYILQQILARQLHASDEECSNYALQLMDKLEAFKAENTANDAIIDDVAAKAYVENFGLETFSRAEESQRSNTVTKQTADTFSAASVFLDLLGVWGKLEAEIANKSKFAKFHALRISKAIKAGQDPNATNPVIEPPPALGVESTDEGIEAELRDLERSNDQDMYKSPTVESIPNSAQPSRPQSRGQGGLATPSAGPQDQGRGPANHVSASAEMESPAGLETLPVDTVETVNSRAGSIGGGYFPAVPDASSISGHTEQFRVASSSVNPSTPSNPADFYATSQFPAALSGRGASEQAHHTTPHPSATQLQTSPVPVRAQAPVQPVAPPGHPAPPPGGYRTDDEAFTAAQKHAKWAISALDYEDVTTAVKELRIALQSLGAS